MNNEHVHPVMASAIERALQEQRRIAADIRFALWRDRGALEALARNNTKPETHHAD